MANPRARMSDWSADDLERAAKFMRELDGSANAKAAFELAKREQDVEIAQAATKGKQAEAERAAHQSQLERIRGEETRKNIEAKRENEKVRGTAGARSRACGTRRAGRWSLL